MPARSKAQQKAAGAALADRRGDAPRNSLKGASKQMEESMSEKCPSSEHSAQLAA